MIFLVPLVIVAIIVIVFFGGRLDNLLNCKFKYSWLVLVALGLKAISIFGIYEILGLPLAVVPYIRILSLFMVVVFVLLNFNLRGLPLVGLGLLSNTLVILFNGGNMPVKGDYEYLVFNGSDLDKFKAGFPVDSFILASPSTKLSFLGDVMSIPWGWQYLKFFSIGDVVITLGGIIFITYCLRKNTYEKFNN